MISKVKDEDIREETFNILSALYGEVYDHLTVKEMRAIHHAIVIIAMASRHADELTG